MWKRILRQTERLTNEGLITPMEAARKVKQAFEAFMASELAAERWMGYHTQIVRGRLEGCPSHLANMASELLRYWAEPFMDWRVPARFFTSKYYWRVVEAIERREAQGKAA